MKKEEKYTNELIHESSPYLLQHAHNPVNWKAWKDENLEKARKEKKLLLISVGYSACHWCHVMEHESFEDEEVAQIMNKNYVPIKVDREERPDVDQVYMNAVQIMTGMGGWPMNVVAMPDGRPVWGGTYFRKEQWKSALQQISHLYETQPEKLEEYAGKLEAGLEQIQVLDTEGKANDFDKGFLEEALKKWQRSFDHKNGGLKGAPKFMMPNNYEFLLRYAFQSSDEELMQYCKHTLDRISQGGVFDVIEGGFSRYSVDDKWHVPHFEKMLYDNAQLVSLYANAYKATGEVWYRDVVEKTLDFVKNELTDESGAFYSALDADSENKEGKSEEGAYYVWTKKELQQILKDDFEPFSEVYNINNYGKWEGENYVLIRTKTFEEIAESLKIPAEELQEKNKNWLRLLKIERKKRAKPGLDDKSLTSWNAMMITAYCDAYQGFSSEEYLGSAKKNADFILNNQFHGENELYHSYKNGKSSINGYLEDYAFVIEAFIKLYETTFEEEYLEHALALYKTVEENFLDKTSGFYFFTSKKDRALVTKTREISDNVIPASNSVMAKNIFKLGKLTADTSKTEKALKMLEKVSGKIMEHPPYHSNWLDLVMNFTHPFYEIAITGKDFRKKASYFQSKYLANKVLMASEAESNQPLLKDRYKEGKTLIYICRDQTCQRPVELGEEAISQLHQV